MSGNKRKSYSVEYKKGIVEESRSMNLTAFCEEKKLDLRMVRKWRAEYGNLCERVDEGSGKKRKIGSGRQPLFADLEDMVAEWIVDRRARSLVVRKSDIQEFALKIAPQFDISQDIYKASNHWVDNFLRRHEFSLRRSTTLFKVEDAEIVKRALAFKSFVDKIDFSKYNLSNMIAMDETAVFMGQGSKTTVEKKVLHQYTSPQQGMKVQELRVF